VERERKGCGSEYSFLEKKTNRKRIFFPQMELVKKSQPSSKG
jgi:hypothetical protein